jgi:hypothetical protein
MIIHKNAASLRLITTGTKDMRIDNATEGRRLPMAPMINVGILVSQWSQEKFSRYWTFEMKPTAVTGIAQKMIKAAMKPMTAILRTTRCHHEIFRDFQTTSLGLMPIYLGDTIFGQQKLQVERLELTVKSLVM